MEQQSILRFASTETSFSQPSFIFQKRRTIEAAKTKKAEKAETKTEDESYEEHVLVVHEAS